MDRRKYSDQGKGQATSQRKAPDVVKRVAEDTERQSLQNKPEVRQRRTSSRESTSGLKKIERGLEKLHVSKPRERNLEGQQQRQGDRHTSNSRQAQRYATQQHWRLMQRSSSASHLGDAGQMRRRLRGGGDPSDDTTEQQEDTNKKREPMDETAGHHVPQRLSRVAGRWEDLKTPPYTQEDEKRWAEQAEIDRKEREQKMSS